MKQSGNKPKKIVINNVRKSIITGGGLSNLDNKPTNNLYQVAGMISQASSPLGNQNYQAQQNQPRQQIQNQASKQIARLNEQLTYYREKHDQSLIKVRFLSQKLETFGGLNSVPQNIVNQISQVDSKIKSLQELLYFRRSKQMKKLKKKIHKFVQMLQFDIIQQDLDKIEDQIQIIFFLIDIFAEKYNNLMIQKGEIDQIVQALKHDTVFNRQQLQQQNKFMKSKEIEYMQSIRQLELQIHSLRKETDTLIRNTSNADTLYRNQSVISNNINQNSRLVDQTIKNLQLQNESLNSKASKLQSSLKKYQYQIINYKRKLQDNENQLHSQRIKYRQLQQELSKVQREEVRWKQRYYIMQKQKNQRIQLLQREKKTIHDFSFKNLNLREFAQIDQNNGSRRTSPTISIKKRKRSEFRNDDHIIQDSEGEYFDLLDR